MALYTEEKIDTRKVLYLLTSLVGILGSIGQAFHLIDQPTADNIGGLMQALAQFLPTAGVTIAGAVLARQVRTPGMLQADGAPEDRVLNGVQEIIANKEAATAAADKVTQGLQSILAGVVPSEIQADIAAAGRALGFPPSS